MYQYLKLTRLLKIDLLTKSVDCIHSYILYLTDLLIYQRKFWINAHTSQPKYIYAVVGTQKNRLHETVLLSSSNNGVARTLKKLRTSKGDYLIKQLLSSIASLFKWELLLKKRIASRGSELFPFWAVPYSMENHFYHFKWPPLNVIIIFITHVRNLRNGCYANAKHMFRRTDKKIITVCALECLSIWTYDYAWHLEK